MGPDRLLGNETLKQRLHGALSARRISHSYLLCGPEGSGKHTLARYLAAAMECTSQGEIPCLRCNQCRKVLEGIHPDVITVDDPEKKTVQVALARQTQRDLYVRPNEGNRKIYLFPRAQDMRLETQNALLKILEEPPAYGCFLLLADRAESLLPTVRSRCEELRLTPVSRALALPFLRENFPDSGEEELAEAYRQSGGFLGVALRFLREGVQADPLAAELAAAFARKDRMELARLLGKLEKTKWERLIPALQTLRALFCEALAAKNGKAPIHEEASLLCRERTAGALLEGCGILQEAEDAANGNVGVGHICGFLAVKLI